MINKQIFCRCCKTELSKIFLNLGHTPLANSYLEDNQLDNQEITYPLKAYVCDECLLVQLDEVATPESIFRDYAYFSGTAPSWIIHAENYCTHIKNFLDLNNDSMVVEVASNDGYLLQHFKNMGIDYVLARNAELAARQSEENRQNNWNWHIELPEQQIIHEFENVQNKLIRVVW